MAAVVRWRAEIEIMKCARLRAYGAIVIKQSMKPHQHIERNLKAYSSNADVLV